MKLSYSALRTLSIVHINSDTGQNMLQVAKYLLLAFLEINGAQRILFPPFAMRWGCRCWLHLLDLIYHLFAYPITKYTSGVKSDFQCHWRHSGVLFQLLFYNTVPAANIVMSQLVELIHLNRLFICHTCEPICCTNIHDVRAAISNPSSFHYV